MQHGPEIVVIAALAARNRLIGRNMRLPWPPLRKDLLRFKRLTHGHVLVVGRLTFESIIGQLGRLLPNRQMVVLSTRGALPDFPGVPVYASLPEAIDAHRSAPVIFVGGGTRPFEEALRIANRLELTIVDGTHEGDTYFPPYEHFIGTRYALTDSIQEAGFRFETYRTRDESSERTRS